MLDDPIPQSVNNCINALNFGACSKSDIDDNYLAIENACINVYFNSNDDVAFSVNASVYVHANRYIFIKLNV